MAEGDEENTARRLVLQKAKGCFAKYVNERSDISLSGVIDSISDDGRLRMLVGFGGADGTMFVRLPLDGNEEIEVYGFAKHHEEKETGQMQSQRQGQGTR